MSRSVLEALLEHGKNTPDKLCAADRKNSASYREMCAGIQAVAGFLKDAGVRKGEIIGLRSSQTISFVMAFFGIKYAGAAACPIEKSASSERTAEILSRISARFILDNGSYEVEGARVLNLDGAVRYDRPLPEPVPFDLDDIADIIFTTGTTGQSKGILVSFRTDKAIAENVIDSVAMEEDEVEFITSPTSHSLAVRRMLAAMYIGSSIVFSGNYMMYGGFWGLIEKYHVTALTFVPTTLKMILEVYGDKLGEYDGQLRYIQLGSAPLHEDEKRKLSSMLPSVRLYNTYGATESGCTIILEFSKYGDKPGCIGRTTVNTTLFFTDEARTKRVEAVDEATSGYMAFLGDMNMSGYIHDEEKTKEVLRDGIIYTNDIGYIGKDGLVYLLGRAGEVINSGGLKINPTEIEGVIGRMEGIKDCACVPAKDSRRGEIPKLFVVFEEGERPSDKEIRQYAARFLEDYKVPEIIEPIGEIPRTFNGKIIRKKLIEMGR